MDDSAIEDEGVSFGQNVVNTNPMAQLHISGDQNPHLCCGNDS